MTHVLLRGRSFILCAAMAGIAGAQIVDSNFSGLPTFGTTVVVPGGLCGEIFHLDEGAWSLPKFEKLEPVGAIYTNALYVPTREWTDGFPGVTKRFEWFAIDYRGRFWIEDAGKYEFYLASDDGSKLYIDGKLLIDLDGLHPTEGQRQTVKLNRGIHRIRVSYFQGPRTYVALMLGIARPKGPLRIFDTNEFKPPSNPDAWTEEEMRQLQAPADPNAGRRKLALKDPSIKRKAPRTAARCPDVR